MNTFRKLFSFFALLLILQTTFVQVSSAQSSKLSICASKIKNQIYAATSCPRGTVKLNYENIVGGKIPSGTTVYGFIGGRYAANGASSFDALASLPGKTAQVFNNEAQIQVANTQAVNNDCAGGLTCLSGEENDNAGLCTGTTENPTAPAGLVCIYPSMRLNAKAIVGYNLVNGFNGNTPSPQNFGVGFGLGWESVNTSGDSLVEAVWAYTAP